MNRLMVMSLFLLSSLPWGWRLGVGNRYISAASMNNKPCLVIPWELCNSSEWYHSFDIYVNEQVRSMLPRIVQLHTIWQRWQPRLAPCLAPCHALATTRRYLDFAW